MKKTVVTGILLVICALSVILPSVWFLLFGYISNNDGTCNYKGMYAPANVCVMPNNRVSEGAKLAYNDTKFSLLYPNSWFLDDSDKSFIYIFVNDPNSSSVTPNDNISVKFSSTTHFTPSASACQSYGEELAMQIEVKYNAQFTKSMIDTINGNDTCIVTVESVINNINIIQMQYLVIDKNNNNNLYFLTISAGDNSNNLNDLIAVAESFELK